MGRQCTACEWNSTKNADECKTQRLPAQCRGPLTACRFTIAFTKEVVVGIGPQTYRTEQLRTAFGDTLNKVTSTRGFALGARLAPRFTSAQLRRPATSSSVRSAGSFAHDFRENAKPFNSSAPRPPVFNILSGPGPGSYEIRGEQTPKRIPFQNHLGHGRTITAPVKVICNRGTPVKCQFCESTIREDFWISRGKFLCNECKEQNSSGRGIVFQKARDCREDHMHEGTAVAIQLRPRSQATKATVREAYLELYFNENKK